MTKAELIRKIAKRAGVPDSEAKVFFEMFLKKSSDLLSPGEAIFLKGYGHFQLRKGKIRNNLFDKENSDRDSIFVELMVYYPTKLREEEVKEEIIFNVPVLKFEDYNPLDSYFSLSIGKPVIPAEGIGSSDFFIPLTGQELRKLVEVRVNKLISEITVVREYTKGNEILIIDTDSIRSHQLEFNWGEVPSKNISDSKLTAKSKDAESETSEPTEKEISWNFGEDISKEIVEDSILDVDKEETSIVGEQFKEETEEELESKTEWNFGVTFVDENETESEENKTEEKISEAKVELVESNVMKNSADEQRSTMSDEDDSVMRFERVRSFSSFFEEGDLTKLPDPSLYKYLRESDTISYEDYQPDQIDEVIKEYSEQNEDSKLHTQHEDEINTIEEPTDEEKEDKQPESGIETEKIKQPAKSKVITRMEERQSHYSREGIYPVFIIALIVIIVIAIALYFYLTKAFVSSKNNESKQLTSSKVVHPNMVERDYSIPVTYPYKNETSETGTGEESINPKILKGKNTPSANLSSKKNTGEKVADENNASSLKFENLPPPIDTSLLHENIVSGENTYTVQISSFQSKSTADRQADKFRAKGYDAYVEKANIPGRGIWYRVKVKNFKSMREAEDFLLSNQQ